MKCLRCGRTITDRQSIIRGIGPACFKAELDELPEHERNLRAMVGYSNYIRKDGSCVVTTPERQAYHVDPVKRTCDCVAWNMKRTCKHLEYVLRDLGEVLDKPVMSEEEKQRIEFDMTFDFH